MLFLRSAQNVIRERKRPKKDLQSHTRNGMKILGQKEGSVFWVFDFWNETVWKKIWTCVKRILRHGLVVRGV